MGIMNIFKKLRDSVDLGFSIALIITILLTLFVISCSFKFKGEKVDVELEPDHISKTETISTVIHEDE